MKIVVKFGGSSLASAEQFKKVADIIQWFIMGIAYITILISASLWVTLTVVGVFLLKYVLELYFMNKYQKEL